MSGAWRVPQDRPRPISFKSCEKVVLVCDNLNTHTKGAFYKVFKPKRAQQLVRRLEFRHTPRHSSWLNIAENELSAMTRQCVDGRRFGDIGKLREETSFRATIADSISVGAVDARSKIGRRHYADARFKYGRV